MANRILSILTCFVLILCISGCGKQQTETYTEFSSNLEGNLESSTDEAASGNGNSNQDTQNNSSKPNQKPSTGATTATDSSGKAVTLANPVYVANGTTKMDENLDFGGKKFTMAVRSDATYQTGKFKRLVAAFEKKFNCKIETKTLEFDNYQTLLASAKTSGKPYDIIFGHGSMFPSIPNANLVNDLSSYLTTADYDTGEGGIDIAKSSYFAIDKNLYGVVGGEDAVHPVVIFYNKLMFQKAGLEDPYELYKSGKWTWSKLQEQGKKVTTGDGKAYYGSYKYATPMTVHSMGTSLMSWKNNKVEFNLDNANVIKGFQIMYNIFNKAKICNTNLQTHVDYKSFADGLYYTEPEEASKYATFCEYASSSAAFNRDASNVGIVPMPQDSAAKKRGYPTGWFTAVMSGTGSSDPRVAVAFAKYWSTYKDSAKDKYELSTEYANLIDKLTSGNIANLHGAYTNSNGDVSYHKLRYPLCQDIAAGKDVASSITSVKPTIQACIDYVTKK